MKTIFQYLPSRLAIVTLLVISLILPVNYIAAQPLTLPPAGDKVVLSTSFQPQMLSAITVDIQNPAQFDFYIDEGQEAAARAHMSAEAAREDYLLLVKDFLVALTIPEDQLWVNLSPYEKDRIIDDRFGQTDMGRDLLAQDYLLKQLTASLLFPEDGTGKAFWDELYSRAHERFGSTDIPVETFNKVWIMPESAEVYQKGPSALVVKGHLKVLLEADYLAMQQSAPPGSVPALAAAEDDRQVMAKQVMRDVVIPVLEKEVNEGQNFARLRQIFNALILAAWYKKAMKESFLGKAYVDRSKVRGVEQSDVQENLRIYDRYIDAFRKGVVNYIREDVDRYTGEVIPRKYLSGGFKEGDFAQKITITDRLDGDFAQKAGKNLTKVTAAGDSSKVVPTKVATKDSLANKKPDILLNIDALPKELKGEIIGMRRTTAAILAKIKKLQISWGEISSSSDRGVKNDMKFLRAHAKKAFQLFMKGEDKSTAKALIDAFNYVVDDPNDSDIQKLILTGEYTIYVFKILATIGMLSRSPDQVQYETVFKYLGLNDALLDQFVKIASSLKSVDDAKAFALSIESIMIGMNPNDKSNPVFLPLPVDAREQLVKIRAERQAAIKKEMQEKVILAAEKARSLLNNSFDFLSGLMGVMGLDKRDNNEKILFSRAKTADSFLKKLDDGDTDLNRVMDWDGGRIGMYTDDSLGDMVKGVRSIIAGSLEFNRYQEDIMKRKKALLQFMHSPGLKNSKKRDYTNKYLEVNNAAENFRDVGTATPKRILVRAVNYYDTLTGTSASSSTPDWYRAIHLIFMLGDGDSTIEVQVKTLLMAILQAFEHKINFKAKEPFPLTDSLKRGIWLANAVEAANYSISRSKNALQGALTHNMQSRGVSLEEKATDSAMKGGIDARNVDGSVRVNAEANAPALEFGGAGMLAGDLDGLTPRILSVQAVEGFSFLAQAAPGTSGAK